MVANGPANGRQKTNASLQPANDADRISVALMAAACGIADAVGFVHTGVFAANMTGNTVLAGLSLANQDWAIALARIVTLATFFGGAMVGRVLQRVRPGQLWLPLFVETVLITASALVDPGQTLFIWLLAGAMGIQATAITKIHGMAISTVVVTSTMARLAETTVDALAGDPRPEYRASGASTGAALMWMSYAGGAIAAVLLMKVTSLSILVSAGVVLLVSVRCKTASARPVGG
jgi:uncharacterized membrane protein YoaK (UPF0700 family)